MAKRGKNQSSTKFIKRADGLLHGVSRSASVFAVSLCVVVVLIFSVFAFVNNRYLAPVNKADQSTINLEIPRGSSVSSIAKLLEANHVIRSATVFRIFVDLYDRGSKLKAGSYEFTASMTVMEVLDKISVGETSTNIVKVFLPEGGTAADLAASLLNLGLIADRNAFLTSMKDPAPYAGYPFLEDAVRTKDKRIMALEGYLFPDTYQVFLGSSTEEIVKKFLSRFNNVFSTAYIHRAEELGMSIDEVVTLASIIQREAKSKDFAKVSAVFHNRLKHKMTLGSDVTVQYILKTSKLNLSSSDIAVDSPYNTYKYAGLPPGPICNPGKAAIEAALWPDESYLSEGMLYFCLADPETGDLVFAKTLAQHNKNVEKYRPLWIKYDQTH